LRPPASSKREVRKRITGISAAGEAEVSFDALPSYKLLYRRMPS
jgi:hypothetical protein